MTLFFFNLLWGYCNPQHRVTSIATAFGPPNFQMEITPLVIRFIIIHYFKPSKFLYNELSLA